MADRVETPLPAGVGYGVVIGVGAFFTLLVSQSWYAGSNR